MTPPRDFIKNTGWGRANNKKYPCKFFVSPLNTHHHTSTLQRPSKQLNPLQASLFGLLSTAIFTDIEIWVSGLENCDKLKHDILQFKNICNPILFATSHYLWTPYHNLRAFRWYNE